MVISSVAFLHNASAESEARTKRLRLGGVLVVSALLVALVVGPLAFAGVLSPPRSLLSALAGVSSPPGSSLLRVLQDLDKRMEGRVVLPEDTDFSKACVVWNQVSSLQPPPKAVIEVASEHDVQMAIQLLASLDVPFSIRSGGHSKAGYSNSPDGIIISLSRLNQIQVSHGSSNGGALAKLGPAITAPGILEVTMPMGYAAVLGLCPTVAEGGFVLGGGFGIMSRKHGLALDNLVSANVVLASSEVVIANSTHNSDLFWALRGAGIGNFGVVTEMTYQLHRSQEAIAMGLLAMPVGEAPTFLERMSSKDVPRELFMILESEGEGNGRFDHLFNHSMKGKTAVVLGWACPEPMCLEAGTAFLREHVATLVNDTQLVLQNSITWLDNPAAHAVTSYTDLVQSFTGFLYPENATVDNLRTIIETFRSWTNEMKPYIAADVELWAGKISDIPPEATAFPHRRAVYNLGVVTVPRGRPAVFASITRRLSSEWHQVGQFLNGAYVNYQMASLASSEYAHAYWGPHVQRLQEIKSKYDPGNLFKYPQGIPVEKSWRKPQ